MTKIRTVVVDDEPVARERIIGLLNQEKDIEVVGEYSDGTQAVSAIQSSIPTWCSSTCRCRRVTDLA